MARTGAPHRRSGPAGAVLVAACIAASVRPCRGTLAQSVLGGLGSALASVRGGATTAEAGGGPSILRRVNSHPLIRVKSYGELSSKEYDELINKLWDASRKGNLDGCFELIKQGAWPNHLSVGASMQTNALMLAAIHGHDQLIELLVHLGAEVNLANNQGGAGRRAHWCASREVHSAVCH